ncbi:MAG: CBS domain-containing protein [Desulfohalobiaceae bacterium]
MTQAKDLMAKNVLTVTPDTSISQAADLLLQYHVNGMPVVDEEHKLVGIICQSDIITQQKNLPLPSIFTLLDGIIPLTSMSNMEKEVQKMAATKVSEAMTQDPVSVAPDAELEDMAEIMVSKNYHTLPVVEGDKLVGVIGKEDVLKTLTK